MRVTKDIQWDLLLFGLSEEAKNSWEEKGDDKEMTGSCWLTDLLFFIKNFHPLLLSLLSLSSSSCSPHFLTHGKDHEWLTKIRKIILDFLLHGNFLVPLNYYVHWGNLSLASPFCKMKGWSWISPEFPYGIRICWNLVSDNAIFPLTRVAEFLSRTLTSSLL